MPTPDALRIVRYNADGLRWCDTCRCYMSPELFHRNRASTAGDGMQRYCKVCSRAVRRDYYQRHRERLVAVSLAYQRQQAMSAERLAEIRRNIDPWLTGTPVSVQPYVNDMIDLLAEVERLRARAVALVAEHEQAMAIVRVVATCDARETRENPNYTRDVVLHSDDINVLWIREQARALLASAEAGEQAAMDEKGNGQ